MILREDIDLGSATHTGLQRGANEDDYLLVALPPQDGRGGSELFAVADGMGGAMGGAEASRAALRALATELLRQAAADPVTALRGAFAAACRRVFQQSREVPTLKDMGTTLTALWLHGQRAVLGHVGDTRALLVRGGTLRQLTTDHAVRTPESFLTRCIGGGQATEDPDVSVLELQPEDRLALVSDGIWTTVDGDTLQSVLLRLPPQRAADELVRLAIAAGGPDNATAVVLHCRPQVGRGRHEIVLPREETARPMAQGGGATLQPPRWPLLAVLLAAALLGVVLLRAIWEIDLLALWTGPG